MSNLLVAADMLEDMGNPLCETLREHADKPMKCGYEANWFWRYVGSATGINIADCIRYEAVLFGGHASLVVNGNVSIVDLNVDVIRYEISSERYPFVRYRLKKIKVPMSLEGTGVEKETWCWVDESYTVGVEDYYRAVNAWMVGPDRPSGVIHAENR